MTDEKCVRCGATSSSKGPSSGTRRCVSSAKVPATSIAAPRSTPLPARLVGISTSISKAVPAARRSEIATEETAAVRNSGRRRTAFRALETPSPAASCRPCVLPPLSEASVRRQRRPVGEDHQRLWDIVANKMKVCQIWPPWTHVSPTRGWGCGLQDPSQESRCPMYNTPTTRRIEVPRGASKIDLTCATDPSPYRVQPGLYSRQINCGAAVSANARNPWRSQVHAHNSTQRTPQSPPLPPDRRNENSRTREPRTAAPG